MQIVQLLLSLFSEMSLSLNICSKDIPHSQLHIVEMYYIFLAGV